MQFEQADQFTGNCCGRLADVKDLLGLAEIDGHRCKVQRRQNAEAKARNGSKKIEHLVAIGRVAPDTDPAAAKRSQRQLGHGGGKLGGDDRVNCVAAAPQDARTGQRRMRFGCGDHSTNAHGQRMRDLIQRTGCRRPLSVIAVVGTASIMKDSSSPRMTSVQHTIVMRRALPMPARTSGGLWPPREVHHQARNTASAAAMVVATSASLCAAETKPASKAEGAK
ncbi:MAG: hypothetical protein CAPSK01_001561 [Candidatus Accumulibacter vicinus]|uniref:Uncharacterized protein n=1 Tax=Candidatus Accumulibacter vicinus TaxID=2954382 RepID=A0A084Y1W3_9PROT|nr:MAG: hypothetical protein CAPSK01_001561 [Candidatus Accumulibacter vicinus]